jgi:hypothetical protein
MVGPRKLRLNRDQTSSFTLVESLKKTLNLHRKNQETTTWFFPGNPKIQDMRSKLQNYTATGSALNLRAKGCEV